MWASSNTICSDVVQEEPRSLCAPGTPGLAMTGSDTRSLITRHTISRLPRTSHRILDGATTSLESSFPPLQHLGLHVPSASVLRAASLPRLLFEHESRPRTPAGSLNYNEHCDRTNDQRRSAMRTASRPTAQRFVVLYERKREEMGGAGRGGEW